MSIRTSYNLSCNSSFCFPSCYTRRSCWCTWSQDIPIIPPIESSCGATMQWRARTSTLQWWLLRSLMRSRGYRELHWSSWCATLVLCQLGSHLQEALQVATCLVYIQLLFWVRWRPCQHAILVFNAKQWGRQRTTGKCHKYQLDLSITSIWYVQRCYYRNRTSNILAHSFVDCTRAITHWKEVDLLGQ